MQRTTARTTRTARLPRWPGPASAVSPSRACSCAPRRSWISTCGGPGSSATSWTTSRPATAPAVPPCWWTWARRRAPIGRYAGRPTSRATRRTRCRSSGPSKGAAPRPILPTCLLPGAARLPGRTWSWPGEECAMPSPVEIVRRFRRLRALVIGDAMLDPYVEGSAGRLCTEGPVPVVRKTGEEQVPGGAANAAANVRALGADVALLGVVGADPAGAQLRAALRARDVDDRWLVEDAGARTLHKLRILADGQYVVRLDDGDTYHLSPTSEARLIAHLDQLYPDCDVVFVSDYVYGAVSDGLLARLRALRAARPGVLVVDSKALRRFDGLGATVVTPNREEARLLVEAGSAAGDTAGRPALAEIESVGRRLLGVIDARCAAITLAGDGVLLVERDDAALHLPAHPVQRAHDVGAGDSFAAALALA